MYVGLVGHQSRVHLTLNLHLAAAFACVSHYQEYGNTWNQNCWALAFKYFANTVVSDRHTKITRNTWSQNYGDVYKAQWEYYWPSVDIKQLCKNCWHTVVILGILGIKSAATLPGPGSGCLAACWGFPTLVISRTLRCCIWTRVWFCAPAEIQLHFHMFLNWPLNSF